jgi:hypothetical protein
MPLPPGAVGKTFAGRFRNRTLPSLRRGDEESSCGPGHCAVPRRSSLKPSVPRSASKRQGRFAAASMTPPATPCGAATLTQIKNHSRQAAIPNEINDVFLPQRRNVAGFFVDPNICVAVQMFQGRGAGFGGKHTGFFGAQARSRECTNTRGRGRKEPAASTHTRAGRPPANRDRWPSMWR